MSRNFHVELHCNLDLNLIIAIKLIASPLALHQGSTVQPNFTCHHLFDYILSK